MLLLTHINCRNIEHGNRTELQVAAPEAAKYDLNRDAQKRFIMDTLTIVLQATCSLDAIEVIDYTSTLRSHNNSFS